MANNNGFFTIHQGGAKQHGQAQPTQKPTHPAVQQTQQRPAGGQQGLPYSQHSMMNHVQTAPTMPRLSVISDVSQGLMTDEDRRRALTSYTCFLWEKIPRKPDTGATGSRKSHWEQAIRTQEQHISERDMVKQIKHLDRTTRHYLDKKKDLDTAAQRQITAAQEQLTLTDNDRVNFRWTLVQIDHQLRELPTVTGSSFETIQTHGQSTRKRSGSRNRIGVGHKENSKAKRRAYHTTYNQQKRRYERVSLIAYFKREPVEHADIQRLYAMSKPQHPQQPHANHVHWSQAQNYTQQNHAATQPPKQQQAPAAPAQAEVKKPLSGQQPVGRAQQIRSQPQADYPDQKRRRGPRLLDNSDSESLYSSSGSDTSITVPSSQAGLRNRKYTPRARATSRERYHHQQHVKLQPEIHQRARTRDRAVAQDSRTRLPQAAVLEQVKDQAYLAGREDEKLMNVNIDRLRRETPRPVIVPQPANSGIARHIKIAHPTIAHVVPQTQPCSLNEYSGDESDDYGLEHLSLDDHRRHGPGWRYDIRDGGRDRYASSSPTGTQDSVFSDDPFSLADRHIRYRSRSPGLPLHIIETRDGHRVYEGRRNRFAPRQTPPTFREER